MIVFTITKNGRYEWSTAKRDLALEIKKSGGVITAAESGGFGHAGEYRAVTRAIAPLRRGRIPG